MPTTSRLVHCDLIHIRVDPVHAPALPFFMHSSSNILRFHDKLVVVYAQPRYRLVSADTLPADKQLRRAYRLIKTPLEKSPIEKVPTRDRVLDAWIFLKEVSKWDALTLSKILIILIESLPGECQHSHPLPSIPTTRQSQETAKHPRLYKGTKTRPPKNEQICINLQPFLCSSSSIQILLSHLAPHWKEAITILQGMGYPSEGLQNLQESPPQSDQLCDPYLDFHYGDTSPIDKKLLPFLFKSDLLGCIRNQSWNNILRLKSVYWQLRLNERDNSRAAVRYLLCRRIPFEQAIAWLEIAASFRPEDQETFLALLNLRRTYKQPVDEALLRGFKELNNLILEEQSSSQINFILLGLNQNIPTARLLDALRLNPHICTSYLQDLKSDFTFPLEEVQQLNQYISEEQDYFRCMLCRIWHRCGLLPGFDQIITQTDWSALSPGSAFKYLDFWVDFVNTDITGKPLLKKWKFLLTQRAKIEQLFLETDPVYHAKLADNLNNYVWRFDNVWRLKSVLPSIYRILKRLCQPPFKRGVLLAPLIGRTLWYISDENLESFMEAPDASFIEFEKACRSRNTGNLIFDGFVELFRQWELFAIQAFRQEPTKLIRIAKSLGVLKKLTREKLIYRFVQDLQDDLYLPNSDTDQSDLAWKLGYLERTIHTFLHANATPQNEEKHLHALQFLEAIEENRRPFRRFLNAYARGNRHYLQDHPKSQAWIQKHQRLSLELWLEGGSWEMNSEKFGLVRFDLENDPLEALKCGTYVKSCLGLGGMYMHSAVAIVLDINKRIIYARNPEKKVIARQLVSISDEDKLVCFEVYPVGVDSELASMFQTVDFSLACALGAALYNRYQHDDYTISHILSQHWWDDGAWDVYGHDRFIENR